MKIYFFIFLSFLCSCLLIYPETDIDYTEFNTKAPLEIVVQDSHSLRVTCITVSPDGNFFVTGGGDSIVKLWNMDGMLIRDFKMHTAPVSGVAFSQDGKAIISAGRDGEIKIYDLLGELIANTSVYPYQITCMVLSPDQKIFCITYSGYVKIWDINLKLLHSFKAGDKPVDYQLALSPEGTVAVCGFFKVKLWTMDGKLLKTLEQNVDARSPIAFSPDGQIIASHYYDKAGDKIMLWNKQGEFIRSIETHSNPQSIIFSPDSKYIFCCDSITGEVLDIQGKHIASTYQTAFMAFHLDGEHLVSGSGTQVFINRFINSELGPFKGHTQKVNSVAVAPTGMIVSGSEDKTVRLWDQNGKLLQTMTGHKSPVSLVSVVGDQKNYIVSLSADKEVKLWSLSGTLIKTFYDKHDIGTHSLGEISSFEDLLLWDALQTERKYLSGHDGVEISRYNKNHSFYIRYQGMQIVKQVRDNIRFSQDNYAKITPSVYSAAINSQGLMASGGFMVIRLLNSSGKLLKVIDGSKSDTAFHNVTSIAFSPDDKYLLTNSRNKEFWLWDTNGELVQRFNSSSTDHVAKLAFSSTGQKIICGRDKEIEIWTNEARLIKTIKTEMRIQGVAISKADIIAANMVAQDSYDNIFINLWDLEGNILRQKCIDSEGGLYYFASAKMNTIAINNKGNLVALGKCMDQDNAIRIWDVEHDQIRLLEGHTDWVASLCFSPDDKYLVSGGIDGRVILWDLENNHKKELNGRYFQINHVSFSPDGRLVLIGGDNFISLWNHQTGYYASLLNDGKEWIIFTDDGYFDCSPNGSDLVAVVKGLKVYGIDQFSIKNNRPDIILNRLGIGQPAQAEHYYANYLKRLVKLNFIPQKIEQSIFENQILKTISNRRDKDFLLFCYKMEKNYYLLQNISYKNKFQLFSLPSFVAYVEKQLEAGLHTPQTEIIKAEQKEKYLDLSFRISDSKYNLASYNIYINNVPLYKTPGKEVAGKDLTITERIELTTGNNKIEVSCCNQKLTESYRALSFAYYHKQVRGDLYYIGLGVSTYKNPSLNLFYPHKDVTDLKTVLLNMADSTLFDKIYTKTLINQQCTLKNIKALANFLANSRANDTVILFIAGHGMHADDLAGTYYFLTYETDLKNISQTAADFSLIEDLLDQIKPRSKLFLMDTCESGELDNQMISHYLGKARKRNFKARTIDQESAELTVKPTQAVKRPYLYEKDRFIYSDIFRRTGAIVFSSSQGNEYSYEPAVYKTDENGFFTKAVIMSLIDPQSDINHDEIITTDEMRLYVINSVSHRSAGLQNPTVDRDNIFQKIEFPLPVRP